MVSYQNHRAYLSKGYKKDILGGWCVDLNSRNLELQGFNIKPNSPALLI